MRNFIDELQHEVSGEVRFDRASLAVYAVDASIFEVEPIAICIPRSKEDIIAAIKIARKHKVPIIPRGAATGISGGCIGKGLVIDTSKYLNRILHIDSKNKIAIVEPGVIQDELNSALLPFGLRLGPDTSTGNRATIGGMVANNSAGAHSLVYGRMCDHVVALDVILYTGTSIQTKLLTNSEWEQKCESNTEEGVLYRTIDGIRNRYRSAIENEFPKISRRSSGYNLDALISCNDLSRLIVGSQGTLGYISQITLKLSPILPKTSLVLIAVKDLITALHELPKCHPFALEMLDSHIIQTGKSAPSLIGKLSFLPHHANALLIYEFATSDTTSISNCLSQHKSLDNTISFEIIHDPEVQKNVWDLRKAGLGLLLSKKSYSRAIAFIEDVAVPCAALGPFTKELIACLRMHGKDAGIYGHIGDGCLHVRPYIDLRKKADVQTMEAILHEVAQLVLKYQGVLSAEHGDGLIRSFLNKSMFGNTLYHAFCELKTAFDPYRLMNPDKIVTKEMHREWLRLTPTMPIRQQDTFFDFTQEGGFELAVDLCNGNGACRKQEGVMCPSYQATLDEKDTTRARAQALRSLIHEKITQEELLTPQFHDIFDLCIQCKGCKTECPSHIDMAKMKSEYLFWYHSRHGYPIRSYLFGYIGTFFRIASIFPRLSNTMTLLMKPLFSIIGLTSKRQMPKLRMQRFSKSRHARPNTTPIVLFSDTFTEFTHESLGEKARTILEWVGYSVIVPPWSCCGRTLLSKGFLPQAKQKAKKLLDHLYSYAVQGTQIVILEPSCLSTLFDEWGSLNLDTVKLETLQQMCRSIDEVLLLHTDRLKEKIVRPAHPIVIHTHCHEKATGGRKTLALLKALFPGDVEEVTSGCCGMAGSFGYEKNHYDISLQIANKSLRSLIDKMGLMLFTVVANGTSCREQLHALRYEKVFHIVELLYEHIYQSEYNYTHTREV